MFGGGQGRVKAKHIAGRAAARGPTCRDVLAGRDDCRAVQGEEYRP